jgi:hypothetical protein
MVPYLTTNLSGNRNGWDWNVVVDREWESGMLEVCTIIQLVMVLVDIAICQCKPQAPIWYYYTTGIVSHLQKC